VKPPIARRSKYSTAGTAVNFSLGQQIENIPIQSREIEINLYALTRIQPFPRPRGHGVLTLSNPQGTTYVRGDHEIGNFTTITNSEITKIQKTRLLSASHRR
jgi:hypothetical protein